MEKVLSFIIPSYNSGKFLDKCIRSMLHPEVLDALEIIVVNDGSTDETEAIAEKYCALYPDTLRLICQENRGHGGALNTGCAAAGGKYLKVVDADDWVETDALPKLIEELRRVDGDVVLTHYYTRNVSTGDVKRWMTYPAEFGRGYSMGEILAHWGDFVRGFTLHGIAYNTEFYRKNAIALSEHVFYEDYEYSTFPCCHASAVVPLDLFVYDYRIGDAAQSVSDANQLKRLGHTETVLNRLIREYRKLPDVPGRDYVCRKAKELLLSYLTTVMLAEPDKGRGRKLGGSMMELFREEMPGAYGLAVKQYSVFCLLNRLHVSKAAFERLLDSKLYRRLRHNHEFT